MKWHNGRIKIVSGKLIQVCCTVGFQHICQVETQKNISPNHTQLAGREKSHHLISRLMASFKADCHNHSHFFTLQHNNAPDRSAASSGCLSSLYEWLFSYRRPTSCFLSSFRMCCTSLSVQRCSSFCVRRNQWAGPKFVEILKEALKKTPCGLA